MNYYIDVNQYKNISNPKIIEIFQKQIWIRNGKVLS